MALEKQDLTTISKYVRDTVNRLPARSMKAVGIGRVTGTPEADTPPASDSSDRLATTAYVTNRTPQITTGPIADGPPKSPSSGDIWIATGAGVAGQSWQFVYNAGSASAYKWEFIGGSPVVASFAGSFNNTALSTQQAWTAAGHLTAPRDGDYRVSISGEIVINGTSASVAFEGLLGVGDQSIPSGTGWLVREVYGVAGIKDVTLATGIIGSATYTAGANVGPITETTGSLSLVTFYNPVWSLVPIRVS